MRRYIAIALSAILLPLCMTISIVHANVYVGGYFKSSKWLTGRAIMGANFPVLFPGIIPAGQYLGPVLSVAGGNPAISSYIYQSFLAAKSDGYIYWNPQIWYRDQRAWIDMVNVGPDTYIARYVEI